MAETDLIDRIRARRDALAAQQAAAERQYVELEQTLALLQRQLDAMHGGLQELDALLKVFPPIISSAEGVTHHDQNPTP